MNANQAKLIPIEKVLELHGLSPERKNYKESWYLSPFRTETEASFHLSHIKNVWHDFGEGCGGNLLDLVMRLQNCDLREALAFMRTNFSRLPKKIMYERTEDGGFRPKERDTDYSLRTHEQVEREQNIMENFQVQSLKHPVLTAYIEAGRKIPLKIAKRYLQEARWQVKGNRFFSLAFPNDSGGFELRNRYFQGCKAPKDVTTFPGDGLALNVFEGFTDYLSALAFYNIPHFRGDVVILNSLSNAAKIKLKAEKYKKVNSFLDNDEAGIKALELFPGARNLSKEIYPDYKDFNDYICGRMKQYVMI